MPRLRVDMEGWKKKIMDQTAGNKTSQPSSQQADQTTQEKDEERLREEAEWSLADREVKRKAGIQEGRKPKKRRLAKVVGWGLSTCQEEETCQEEPRIEKVEDWVSGVEVPSQNLRQEQSQTG